MRCPVRRVGCERNRHLLDTLRLSERGVGWKEKVLWVANLNLARQDMSVAEGTTNPSVAEGAPPLLSSAS